MRNILLFIESGQSLEVKLKKISHFQTSVFNIPLMPDFLKEIDLIIISRSFCKTTDKTQDFLKKSSPKLQKTSYRI